MIRMFTGTLYSPGVGVSCVGWLNPNAEDDAPISGQLMAPHFQIEGFPDFTLEYAFRITPGVLDVATIRATDITTAAHGRVFTIGFTVLRIGA